jgi:AcrR family transcriptional regulator
MNDPFHRNLDIRKPQQKRSEESMLRTMAALERLLEEKPFSAITIQELSTEAEVNAPSIYARFGDKMGLLGAAHDALREQTVSNFDDLFTIDRWRGGRVSELLSESILGTIAIYRRKKNLIRAVLLSDDPGIYARMAKGIEYGAALLADLLARAVPPADRAAHNARVNFAIRATTAILRQTILFEGYIPAPFGLNDKALADEMALLVCRQVGIEPQARFPNN